MYGEFELIEKIAALFETPEGLTLGIGDDCAILDPGRFDLVTTDMSIEGVHFRRDWSRPEAIGWRALAACLSDIAAMGGGPGAFFMNLALGPDDDEAFVDGLLAGMKAICDELVPESFQVAAGGGDISRSPGPTMIGITLLGEASPAGPVTRAGALPGDRIALLGPVGMSAGGLSVLRGVEQGVAGLRPADYPALLEGFRRPRPRVREGALLGLFGAPSALIDISDGLLADLGHIMDRSGVGATIEVHNLPRHPELVRLAEATGRDVLDFVLSGGEDGELLVVVPPARMTKLWDLSRKYDWDVYDIGEIRAAEEGLRILAPDGTPMPIENRGWRHFEGR